MAVFGVLNMIDRIGSGYSLFIIFILAVMIEVISTIIRNYPMGKRLFI